jgi:RimJ/RimL family protein N-acetyltransferase
MADGLVLDTLRPSDVERIREYCQDPEVQRWTTIPVPYGRADASDFVTTMAPAGWAAGSELTWAIRDRTGAGALRLAGTVGLRLDGAGSAEVGFLLAPDCRGRGLATVATRAACRHALDPAGLGQRRVVWKAAVGNWASRAVAVRAGFCLEGTIRSEIVVRDRPLDAWVGTLIAGDPAIVTETWADVPLQGLPAR